MRKIVKYTWFILKSILICILLTYTTTSVVEHVEYDILLSNFKKNAVYQESISSQYIKYYKIESNEKSSAFTLLPGGNCLPGASGDILVCTEQITIAPIVNEIVSFYAGGHAAYVLDSYSDSSLFMNDSNTIETTVTNSESNGVAELWNRMDWTTNEYFPSVIGLRVKMSDEEHKKVDSVITSMLGDPYNSSFIFNTVNTSYCTDLISKSFTYIHKNLNADGLTTSVYDLIVSKDTYISYYHFFDSNGIKYIYYLG